jgi:hypothetical protein
VWRSLLASARGLGFILDRCESLSEIFGALDGAIEFFLLTDQNVAHVLQPALEVGDSALKIIKTSGFGHDVCLAPIL